MEPASTDDKESVPSASKEAAALGSDEAVALSSDYTVSSDGGETPLCSFKAALARAKNNPTAKATHSSGVDDIRHIKRYLERIEKSLHSPVHQEGSSDEELGPEGAQKWARLEACLTEAFQDIAFVEKNALIIDDGIINMLLTIQDSMKEVVQLIEELQGLANRRKFFFWALSDCLKVWVKPMTIAVERAVIRLGMWVVLVTKNFHRMRELEQQVGTLNW